MVLNTRARKMAQVSAKTWPWLACWSQIRLAAGWQGPASNGEIGQVLYLEGSYPWLCVQKMKEYLAPEHHQPPKDHHTFLGVGLLQCPTGGGIVVSEVPL